MFSTQTQKNRPLTQGEITIAKSVFGDTLQLDNIRLKTAWWVLKNYAVSPNGNIYFNQQDWIEDFSEEPLHLQAWLVHELTHVWQIQQGTQVLLRALFNRRYNYELKENKPFFSYGVEQQARMVEDYYKQREQGKDCTALIACIPFLSEQTLTQA